MTTDSQVTVITLLFYLGKNKNKPLQDVDHTMQSKSCVLTKSQLLPWAPSLPADAVWAPCDLGMRVNEHLLARTPSSPSKALGHT